MPTRKQLSPRRGHLTHKVKIGGQRNPKVRTLYMSLDHQTEPSEVWLRVKQKNLDAEVIALYDWGARLASLALQYGAPLEKIAGLSFGVRVEPCGPVEHDERIKNCQSVIDYVGRNLYVHCLGRDDLAHTSKEAL